MKPVRLGSSAIDAIRYDEDRKLSIWNFVEAEDIAT